MKREKKSAVAYTADNAASSVICAYGKGEAADLLEQMAKLLRETGESPSSVQAYVGFTSEGEFSGELTYVS